jgi:hypothetical protein
LYHMANCRPVWPTYALWQSGQISLYITDEEKSSGGWSLRVSILPKVWVVQKAILSSDRLKILVM